MVLVTPSDNPAGITKFADLDKPAVPSSSSASTPRPAARSPRRCSTQDHITEPASTEVDVKCVLAKVTEGEADAGHRLHDRCRRRGRPVNTVPIPGTSQQTTTYPIATLDQSKEADLAQEFVDLVTVRAGPAGPGGRGLRRAVR